MIQNKSRWNVITKVEATLSRYSLCVGAVRSAFLTFSLVSFVFLKFIAAIFLDISSRFLLKTLSLFAVLVHSLSASFG